MKTILIIEDDRAVAATYRHKFKEAGFRVEIAPDGIEGVKMVSTLCPDAVVLDLLMPRLDGIEVLKFIRGHPELSSTPVVVFSNSYMTNLVESAWRAGADECLMKSSTMPSQLLDAVNKVMSRVGRRRTTPPANAVAPMRAAVPTIDPLAVAAPPPARATTARPMPAVSVPPVAPTTRPVPAPPARTVYESSPPPPFGGPPTEKSGEDDRFTINYEEPAPEPRKNSPGTTFFIAGTQLVAEPDTDFHAQIRELFLSGSGARLDAIRETASTFVQAADEIQRAGFLDDLFRKIHSLSGNAGLAGSTDIAHFASTFEVLLKELRDQPGWQNHSTINSVARAVEALEAMFINPGQFPVTSPKRNALVVEADTESCGAAEGALEAANIRTTVTIDPVYALGMLASTNYDLVVTGIPLQDMTGFELITQMQSMSQHALTPVVFVTSHENFPSYLGDEAVARHDLIAKPFLHIELALKALARVNRKRFQP